jgi:hypothetical protein
MGITDAGLGTPVAAMILLDWDFNKVGSRWTLRHMKCGNFG